MSDPDTIKTTEIQGLVLLKPNVYPDHRGCFTELYNRDRYQKQGLPSLFVQDNLSVSKQGVLRGLHYQRNFPQGKLVTALTGEIFDVAVDLRPGSATFGRWEGYWLTETNRHQLYIPEGFAHGFAVTSEQATVLYKCTALYHAGDDYGILWNDPDLAIAWPVSVPVLSEKDAQLPRLSAVGPSWLPT